MPTVAALVSITPSLDLPTPNPGQLPGLDRSIVLVGMMGAGKTAVGRRLAKALGWRFQDADWAIEKAAGTTIANIFAEVGEAAFRQSERQVIARLLAEPERQVLALGGGAFIDPATRALCRAHALSIWLDAGLDVLAKRTSRRQDRPLLSGGEPREVLAELLAKRAPIYAEADLVVDSASGTTGEVAERVLAALASRGNGSP